MIAAIRRTVGDDGGCPTPAVEDLGSGHFVETRGRSLGHQQGASVDDYEEFAIGERQAAADAQARFFPTEGIISRSGAERQSRRQNRTECRCVRKTLAIRPANACKVR
jgi:hypothetical protein